MCRVLCVLAVVALSIGVVHSWDFAVGVGDQLMFYTDDGTKTETVHFESRNLGSIAYDEVHNMMLYVDKQNSNDSICGYNLSSKENVCFQERSGRNILSIAYDPVTERIFFIDTNEKTINWIPLNCESNNNISGNLVIKMDTQTPTDIAVESCGGYIYWSYPNTTYFKIERVLFNGGGREPISSDGIDTEISLTIDPIAHKIYYFDKEFQTIWSKSLSGKNLKLVLTDFVLGAKDLTDSKENIYWVSSSECYKSVWKFPKDNDNILLEPTEIMFYTNKSLSIAANYKILDQLKELHDCESLSNTNASSGGQSR